MSKETRDAQFQVKALGVTKSDDGQEFGHIEAYGAVFNNVDDGNDRILPGAFKRTIKNSKDRAISRSKRYILPLLWQHDTNELIGGWTEITEDNYGLKCKGDIALGTQRGKEYYELAKAGMADQFSIIYDVPSGGAKYDKSGVRELSEIRLYSIDVVTFAMNDATYTVGVKSMELKALCGNTSGAIGPRDESWDGSKAEKQIWDAAEKDDGSINTTLAKKYFMVCDGDGSKKGDYSYPFWYVGDDPHICVGAVKAIAAAIQGARGASAPAGLKSKVETLYSRINKKYPDDPELTPPWKDDGKSRGRHMQRKDFNDHYREEVIEDWLTTDFSNLVCALKQACIDMFAIGDEPQSDIETTVLNDGDDSPGFISAIRAWVQKGIDIGVSDYLNELSSNGSDYPLGYGIYSYMSRRERLARKAMTAGDATTGGFTADHVDALHTAASKAMKKVQDHADALHEAADNISSMISGSDGKSLKAGRAFSAANAQALQDHADDLNDKADSLTKAITRQMKSVNSVADDLATILQGSEAAYGSDPGNAGDQQEGKHRASYRSDDTHAALSRSSQRSDTVEEEKELAAALSNIRQLRTSLK